MPQSTGVVGRGTTLEISDDVDPAVWATVANVTSINITGRSAEEVDFTTLNSDGGYRELRQGLRDGGTVEFGLHFDPDDTTYTGTPTSIVELFESGDLVKVGINMSGAGKAVRFVGRGFVMNPGDLTFENSSPVAGTATIRFTGPVTIEAVV